MKIKIRTMAVMMTAAMMIGLTGCGAEKTLADVTVQEKVTVAEAEAKAEVFEEETVETEEPAETDVTEEQPEEETVDTEVEASEQAAEEESLKAEETAEKVEEQKTEEQKTEEQKTEAKKSNIPDWFDAEFYAANNSDVVAALGSGADALYNHYVTYGKAEGRKANADDPAEPVVTANSGNESNNNDSAGSNNSSSVVVDTNIPSYDEFVNTMLADVNALRREQGVGDLVLDEQCNNVGNLRANEIATYFSHTRPDGRSFYTAWEDLGYEHPNVGENLSKYMIGGETISLSQAAHDTFDIFSDSPTHYENMIKAKWTKVYFNVYIIQDGSRTYYYCVQTFSK